MEENYHFGPLSMRRNKWLKSLKLLRKKMTLFEKNTPATIPNLTVFKTNLDWESEYQKFLELASSKKEKFTLTTFLSKLSSRSQSTKHPIMRNSLTGFLFTLESKIMKIDSSISLKNLCQWSWQTQPKTSNPYKFSKFFPKFSLL